MPRRKPAPAPLDDLPPDGRARAVIETITPAVDDGRFAVKRIAGDRVDVEADCFADGHDVLVCMLRYRREEDADWQETPMAALGNDRWRGAFTVPAPGRYRYAVTAWVDAFLSWRRDYARRLDADDLRVAALVGADLIDAAAKRASGKDGTRLKQWAARLRDRSDVERAACARARRGPRRGGDAPSRPHATRPRIRSNFRSSSTASGRASARGTSCSRARAPRRRACTARCATARQGCPTSRRWASTCCTCRRSIRSAASAARAATTRSTRRHRTSAVHGRSAPPRAATRRCIRSSARWTIFARSCRPRGRTGSRSRSTSRSSARPTIRTCASTRRGSGGARTAASSTPRTRPRNTRTSIRSTSSRRTGQALWLELESVFAFWIAEGVRIFRVDNPHTKPFAFWEWAIGRIKRDHPDVLFLAEAFTRPRVMHRLAKLGFSQSYTYFAWRNAKAELTEYFTELTRGPGRDYFRPNCWPNTPDILTEYLQLGGRAAFMSRVVLAATLCRELRDLRPRLRAARARAARARHPRST